MQSSYLRPLVCDSLPQVNLFPPRPPFLNAAETQTNVQYIFILNASVTLGSSHSHSVNVLEIWSARQVYITMCARPSQRSADWPTLPGWMGGLKPIKYRLYLNTRGFIGEHANYSPKLDTHCFGGLQLPPSQTNKKHPKNQEHPKEPVTVAKFVCGQELFRHDCC